MLDDCVNRSMHINYAISFLFGLLLDVFVVDNLMVLFGYTVSRNLHDFNEFSNMVKDRGFYEIEE